MIANPPERLTEERAYPTLRNYLNIYVKQDDYEKKLP